MMEHFIKPQPYDSLFLSMAAARIPDGGLHILRHILSCKASEWL